jgi:hypothetical protein
MSQLILDDQLKALQVLRPLRKWITVQRLRDLRPNQQILDDRVPQILWTLKQPTFVTIDHGFWKRSLCHPDYTILVFALRDDQQILLPGLLRALLRRQEFRTRKNRMGKVARISTTAIDYWEFPGKVLRHIDWKGG